jgi:hypothetical protein
VCARILGLRIAEVAIPTIYADEVSHLKPIAYGWDVLRIVRRFRRGVYAAMLKEPGASDGRATAAIGAGR